MRVEDLAGVFVGVADAAVGAEQADDVQDDVLGVDAGAEVGRSTSMRRTLSCPSARVCVASTSRTWVVPMPKAIAPNAPCVEVWESPQAIVVPGWVMPCSGPTTWTMPCLPVGEVEVGDAEIVGSSCAVPRIISAASGS